MRFQDDRARNHIGDAKENSISSDVNMARQAIYDKLESQIKTAEAKLDTLKARAETAKANIELILYGWVWIALAIENLTSKPPDGNSREAPPLLQRRHLQVTLWSWLKKEGPTSRIHSS
jgi:hypothetical protein